MTNWQLIATLATLVIAIYSANWSLQRNLKEHIEAFRREVDAKLDLLRAEFKAEIAEAKNEFRAGVAEIKAEQRVTNHRLEALENRFKPVTAD
jgi:adenylosuccinate lyase